MSIESENKIRYAIVDLGSNSFHLLIFQYNGIKTQILNRFRQKICLAEGLDKNNMLSYEAMQRGWHCLRWFAKQLKNIPTNNIVIVATATLRTAKNHKKFIEPAQKILGYSIPIISGQEEANLIYMGATTSGSNDKQRKLVIDIGGASTELIVGQGKTAIQLFSLPMGCVTWLTHYFPDKVFYEDNFKQAESAAKELLKPIISKLNMHGWDTCLGASGTIQSLKDIAQHQPISLDFLLSVKQQIIACRHLDQLSIKGLRTDRQTVFPSGLAILIAIFSLLPIQSINVAEGALREGLMYQLLNYRN